MDKDTKTILLIVGGVAVLWFFFMRKPKTLVSAPSQTIVQAQTSSGSTGSTLAGIGSLATGLGSLSSGLLGSGGLAGAFGGGSSSDSGYYDDSAYN